MTATALVVDRPHDGATDLIVNALAAVGVPVFRFDMADFPLSLHLDARHEETDGWTGVLETDHRAVELADIGAVYWNRPDHFVLPAMSPADEHYSRGAARHGLGGVLAGLPVAWMNHPNRASAAEFKPDQLRTARSAGLHTPRTLITNDPEAVRRFAKTCGTPLVTKPMGIPYVTHDAGTETMRTRPVDLNDLGGIETTAHLVQEQITKAYEVRLYAVGSTHLAVRITAGSEAARLDWRTDYDALTYDRIDVPAPIAAAVNAYMSARGLTYAALDFAVERGGRWVYFEANPAGQFAWLHEVVPVAEAIAETVKGWCT